MVSVTPVPEPADFDTKARQPGNAWLGTHPHAERPRDYWSPFRPALAKGFSDRCGYTALYEPNGTVDHFIACADDPTQVYEWDNYRYASNWVNSSKGRRREGELQVLDPYEVGEDWFEVSLPDLQLRLTDKIPPRLRERAEWTLKRLRLRNDPRVIRHRQGFYQMYVDKKLTLEGLRDYAPLIARAVDTQMASAKNAHR